MSELQDILSALEYGSLDQKIEATTVARGRVNKLLLTATFDKARTDRLVSKVSAVNRFTPNDCEKLCSALWKTVESRNNLFMCWYATIALVDLGDVTRKCLQHLLDVSQQVITWLVDIGNREDGALVAAIMELEVQEETIRALSRFGAEPEVTEILKECFAGRFMKGRQGESRLRQCALYAFGVIGIPELRPLVEYQVANTTDKQENAGATMALKLWGCANYDEIVVQAAREAEKGFLRRFFG